MHINSTSIVDLPLQRDRETGGRLARIDIMQASELLRIIRTLALSVGMESNPYPPAQAPKDELSVFRIMDPSTGK